MNVFNIYKILSINQSTAGFASYSQASNAQKVREHVASRSTFLLNPNFQEKPYIFSNSHKVKLKTR